MNLICGTSKFCRFGDFMVADAVDIVSGCRYGHKVVGSLGLST